MERSSRNVRPGGKKAAQSGTNQVAIADLLPKHLRMELLSDHMTMLSNASILDYKSASAETKMIIKADNITTEEVEVFSYGNHTYSKSDHLALMCKEILPMVDTNQPLEDHEAIGMFLQAMVVLFGRSVLSIGGLADNLKKCGVTLNEKIYDPTAEEDRNEIRRAESTQTVKAQLKVELLGDARVTLMAYWASVLLMAGKQLNAQSAAVWTQRRVVGLSASMGTVITASDVTPFNPVAAQRVYQKISLHYLIKATMVRVLLGTSGEVSERGVLSGALLNLLAWSEMNHIRMVQEFIFGRYPELLSMRQLQGSSLGALKAAWSYLLTLEEAERPYAKLLYSPQETKALQRDRFILLIDAAHAVGNSLYNSFSNYQGDSASTAGAAVKKIVMEYLSGIDRTSTSLVQAAQYTVTDKRLIENMSEAEKFYSMETESAQEDIDEMGRS